MMCECEHVSHFGEGGDEKAHEYGQTFPEKDLHAVKTIYGTFTICNYCKSHDHISKEFRIPNGPKKR